MFVLTLGVCEKILKKILTWNISKNRIFSNSTDVIMGSLLGRKIVSCSMYVCSRIKSMCVLGTYNDVLRNTSAWCSEAFSLNFFCLFS